MDDEQVVKATWLVTHYCDGYYRDYPRGVVLIWSQDEDRHWLNFDSWAAAAEFTRNRLEEIRQVEREIEELLTFSGSGGDWCEWGIEGPYVADKEVASLIRGYTTRCRILAREQAALAELKRGMRS